MNAKINKLPVDVAGLHADKPLLQQYENALETYSAGADFAVNNTTLVVNLAKETHDAAETAIQIGGVTSIAATGAELLTEEGCAAFVQYTAQQIENTANAVALSYVSQYAFQLVAAAGIDVDAQYVQIGADGLQLVSLWAAAKAERNAAGSNCFVAGTEVATALGSTPIQNLQVGDRVLTALDGRTSPGAPPPPIGDPNATSVDPATWREITLDMPDPQNPGNDYLMQLLEPMSWIRSENAQVGGWIDLSLPELQMSGRAEVESVNACPNIQGGDGRVVLGTFEHVSHDLVDVNFAGQTAPLQVTSGHKLWSLDRGDWVQAGDLKPGERLATGHGEVTVQSVTTDAAVVPVYNLDVETDHRYFVSADEVLAHNASPCPYGNEAEFSVDKAIKFPNEARSDMRAALGLTDPNEEAHHILPIGLLKDRDACDFLEKAAKGGFHFNGLDNGEAVPAGHGWGDNTAAHASYTAEVLAAIEDILPQVTNEDIAAELAANLVMEFRGKILTS